MTAHKKAPAKKPAKRRSTLTEIRERVDILWKAHRKAELTAKLQTTAEGTEQHQAVAAELAELDKP